MGYFRVRYSAHCPCCAGKAALLKSCKVFGRKASARDTWQSSVEVQSVRSCTVLSDSLNCPRPPKRIVSILATARVASLVARVHPGADITTFLRTTDVINVSNVWIPQ